MNGTYQSEGLVSVTFSFLKKALVSAVILMAVLLVFSPVSHAQITGTITGTVADSSGAVVPGATVSLMNQDTRDRRVTVSNGEGYFSFASVFAGTYTVKVEFKGFKTFEQKDLALQASDKRNVNATLEVGQTSDVVTVEAHTDLTPVDSGARSLDLTAEDYAKLPMITRNASELLRTLPGVVTVGNGTANGASGGTDFSGVGAAGSSVGNGVSISGAPYRGGTSLLMDGTNILDEGCDCTSISVPNPDMVQEVKVQTSAFSAESSKGPVVINFLTKSGGAQFHGEGYLYARNAIFNSDDWQDNHEGHNVATGDHYYYPGGNVGGPVPFTHKKLLFWAGYEHFYQLATGGAKLTSYIPTPDMIGTPGADVTSGFANFSATSMNNALCQADLGVNADTTASNAAGTYCYAPETGLGPGGSAINAAAVPIDPGAAALWKLMPTANVDPTTTPGGYNYYFPVPALHNGFVFRGRGDYSLDENNKLFITYQLSKDSQPSDGDSHMWWLPGNSVVFPGGGLSNPTETKNVTGNFVHIFSPTLTNQLTAFWTYYSSPQAPANFNAVLRGTVDYPSAYGTQFTKTNTNPDQNMVPGWNSAGNETFPDFSQWDVFSQTGGKYFIKKENPAFSDDVTKVYRDHTVKVGFYYEMTGNNQGNFNPYNGGFSFGSSSTPYPDAVCLAAGSSGVCPGQGTQNPTANFMLGIASNYNEQSSLPLNDQAYKTFALYVTDSFKVTRRFTADFGIRAEHLGHWYDRDGYGNAVWVPGDVLTDVQKGKVFPGVEWHGIDPGIPLSGTPNRIFHVEPRAGIAYDIFGTGETVVRGGWGLYMFNDQVNDYSGPLALAQQSIQTSLPSNTTVLFGETGNLPKPTGVFSSPSGGPGSILNPNDYNVPWVQTWNFTIDQRTPWNTRLEVAYEGNKSGALFFGGQVGGGGNLGGSDYINVNKTPLGAYFNPNPITGSIASDPENVCGTEPDGVTPVNGPNGCLNGLADYHPFGTMNIGSSGSPDYVNVYGTNGISVEQHAGYSDYNALAVIFSKQTGRFTFNTSFLWSKALGFGNGNINPFVLRDNYVLLNIDRPYVWNASYTYDLGKAYHGDNKLVGGAANGWIISGFTTWQKGADLQAQTSENLGLNFQYSFDCGSSGVPRVCTDQLSQRSFYGTDAGINVQPVETCNPKNGLSANQFAKLSCFAAPAIPTGSPAEFSTGNGGYISQAAVPYSIVANGPTQLPYISMPSFFDSDLALYKTFHITERHTVEFRVTATNFLNHPLIGYSNNNAITLKYSLDPTNKGAGYTNQYLGSVTASTWGVTDTKYEPNTAAYGRVLQFGLKYAF